MEQLREVYESFCNFGSGRNLATGSMDMCSTIDGAKFAKFAKDCQIIDGKKVTTTDVDIIFNKCKAKGARRMEWDQFRSAFQLLADKKYPNKSPAESYITLLHTVTDNKGPIARGTVTQATGVYDKLTNTSMYTGSHKERFDANGIGKGSAGRDMVTQTDSLHKIVNRSTNSAIPVNTVNSRGVHSGSATITAPAKKRDQASIITLSSEQLDVKSSAPKKVDLHKSAGTLAQSTGSINKSTGSINKNTTTKASSGNVFDRLTNVSGYTGAHKERFNADGTGRGLQGRVVANEGTKNLSQIVRH